MEKLYAACKNVCDSIVQTSLKETIAHDKVNAELSLCKAELRKDVSRLKEELKKW